MKKTTRFKKYILADEILVLPVVHDALCARIAEESGFNAICAAGYANSAAMLGKPDVSLLTLTEMVDCAGRIADAVNIPVFADGDTGHGNVTNVIPGGKTPILSAKELQELGYAAVAYPTACTYTIAKAVKDLFEELHRTGTIAGFDGRMLNFEQFNQLVGLPEIRETEKKYYHKIV
jgi:methylisocitrate lyase